MASVLLGLGLSLLSATAMVSVSDFSKLLSDDETAEFIASVEIDRAISALPAYDTRGAFSVRQLLADEGWSPGAPGDCPAGAGEWADASRFDGLAPAMVCLSMTVRSTAAGCSALLEWHVRRPGRQLLRGLWSTAARSVRLPDDGVC